MGLIRILGLIHPKKKIKQVAVKDTETGLIHFADGTYITPKKSKNGKSNTKEDIKD